MKFQRQTLALLSLAVISTITVSLVEYQGRIQTEVTDQQQDIFNFEETQVQRLRVMTQQDTLIFERQPGESPPSWHMKAPMNQPASDAAIAFLLSKLTNLNNDKQILDAADSLTEYGLNAPNAVVEVTLDTGEIHQLVIGTTDFSDSFFYAQADPSSTTKPRIILIPKDFEYAINRPLSEWQPSPLENPETTPETNPEITPEITPDANSPTLESPNPDASPLPVTP